MKYGTSTEDFFVELTESVSCRFKSYMKCYDYGIESGGILVGILKPTYNSILITDITEPYDTDRQSKNKFCRMEAGHQEAMDLLWEQSNHKKTYMGEWHTHNQNTPSPSNIDINNWKRISCERGNSDRYIFIIVGKLEIGVWMAENNVVLKLELKENQFEGGNKWQERRK